MRTKDYDKQHRSKEALIRVTLQEGMSGASISKIAREAGVSPATIYVYYDSKEAMLADIFAEYSHQSYHYLMDRVDPKMAAADLIDAIVRGYYAYSTEHEEVFSFVEQCSRCPTLSEQVSEQECCCEIFDLFHTYQDRGLIRRCSDASLAAVLFAPVRFLANNSCLQAADPDAQLSELVQMLQQLLCRG